MEEGRLDECPRSPRNPPQRSAIELVGRPRLKRGTPRPFDQRVHCAVPQSPDDLDTRPLTSLGLSHRLYQTSTPAAGRHQRSGHTRCLGVLDHRTPGPAGAPQVVPDRRNPAVALDLLQLVGNTEKQPRLRLVTATSALRRPSTAGCSGTEHSATGSDAPHLPMPCHAAQTSGSCRSTFSGDRRRSPSSAP